MSSLSTRRGLQSLVLVGAAAGALAAAAFAQPSKPAQPASPPPAKSPTTPAAKSGMDADAKALAKLDDEWSAAAAARDVERVASYYAEDAVAYPPGEPVAVGREAAKKVWAAYFAEPSFKISWKTERAEVSKAGDFGLTSGSYDVSYNGPDGKTAHEKGKYLCTWKRQKDGSWKAAHDMWNADSR